MASTVSFSPANVQMLQARSGHGHAAFGSCSAVPRAGLRLRSMAVRVSSEQEAAAAVRAPSGRTIEECEADAVAGKFPAPPPLVRPKAPEGTPEIRPLDMAKRPRRNRKSPALRAAFQETSISPANFVLPLFIHEGEEDAPIGAMPGCYRLGWRHGLLDEVLKLLGIISDHECTLGTDPLFLRMRREMRQKILDCLRKETKPTQSHSLEILSGIAGRLEERLYRLHSSKADYVVMLKEQIEPYLQAAIKDLSSGRQRQQMSHQTPIFSTYRTTVPTPGSISNDQDPSIIVAQNSIATSDSSVICPVIMQQQVDHMVQATGFSYHRQNLPANPVYPNGAGCLNVESNAVPLVQGQKPMPFSINQSNDPLQHLGTHVGSGVHSIILENSSSHGSSYAQIDGDMGSNMQLSKRARAAAREEFTNLLSYGNSPDKSFQREFNCHPPQGTQMSAGISRNCSGVISSTLTSTDKQSTSSTEASYKS